MKNYKIIRKKKMVKSVGGSFIEFNFPDFDVLLPDSKELALSTATQVLEIIKQNLSQGKDAEGKTFSLNEETIKRRKYDKEKPENSFRWGSSKTKTGKIKKKYKSDRWDRRFPDGQGSKGGRIAFNDSGYLLRNLRVDSITTSQTKGTNFSTYSAMIFVPTARIPFINAIEKGRVPDVPKTKLIAIKEKVIDEIVNGVADSAFSGKAGILLRALAVKGMKGLGMLALMAGADTMLQDTQEIGGQENGPDET